MASWIAMIGSMVIGSLLLLSFLRYGNDITRDSYLTTLEHITYENLAEATEVLERELSLVGVGINDPTFYPLLEADSTAIRFCWDADGDSQIDTLRYFRSEVSAASATDNPNDRVLNRTLNGNTEVVAVGVIDFKMRYFDYEGIEITTAADIEEIRVIEFELTIESTMNYDNNYPRIVWHGRVMPLNLYGK